MDPVAHAYYRAAWHAIPTAERRVIAAEAGSTLLYLNELASRKDHRGFSSDLAIKLQKASGNRLLATLLAPEFAWADIIAFYQAGVLWPAKTAPAAIPAPA